MSGKPRRAEESRYQAKQMSIFVETSGPFRLPDNKVLRRLAALKCHGLRCVEGKYFGLAHIQRSVRPTFSCLASRVKEKGRPTLYLMTSFRFYPVAAVKPSARGRNLRCRDLRFSQEITSGHEGRTVL